MNKKILLITYYWPPSGGPGVQRWLKLSKYLPDFGIDPIVLTVDPKYASYPQEDESLLAEISDNIKVFHSKSFEPLKLYSRLKGKEKVPFSGFANVDTQTTGSKIARFIRGNFFVPDARVGWNRYAYKKAVEIIREEKIDLVITTGPPHSTHLIGEKLKRNLKIFWVADFRDPWTEIYYYEQLLHTPFVKEIDKKLEQKVIDRCDLLLAVAPSNLRLLRSKLKPEDKEKIKQINNGFDENDYDSSIEKVKDQFQIAYTGTIAGNYNPQTVLEVIFKIIREHPEKKVKFKIAGKIAPEIEEMIRQSGVSESIDYVGYLPHKKSVEILSESHLLLHIMSDKDKTRMGLPGKLYEYIGSGTPILNIAPSGGDTGRLINETKSGETFDRNQVKEIESFIMSKIQQDSPLKKEELSIEQMAYSRRNLAKQLAGVLREPKIKTNQVW